MTFNRLIAVFLLLMASAWVALVNGQPLFMADTSAYVRGPDFAAVYLFGDKVATSWTQERTLHRAEHSSQHVNSESPDQAMSMNAPFDKASSLVVRSFMARYSISAILPASFGYLCSRRRRYFYI